MSAAQRMKDFEAMSRLTDELIADMDQLLGSSELERYSDQENIRYAQEEKTTKEQLDTVRSCLAQARSRFPAIEESLRKTVDL